MRRAELAAYWWSPSPALFRAVGWPALTLPRPLIAVEVRRATLVGWTPIRVPYRRPPGGAPKLWRADSFPAVLSRLKLAVMDPMARCQAATSAGSARRSSRKRVMEAIFSRASLCSRRVSQFSGTSGAVSVSVSGGVGGGEAGEISPPETPDAAAASGRPLSPPDGASPDCSGASHPAGRWLLPEKKTSDV